MHLTGKKLPIKDFRSYLDLFNGVTPPMALKQIDGRCEVGVGVSANQSFQQISFVDSIATIKGRGHIFHIANQVAKKPILEW